mgnify:CR=1 FL=1
MFRKYLLCRFLFCFHFGIQRDNLSLPEYKAAMREVEQLEQQAAVLDKQNEA